MPIYVSGKQRDYTPAPEGLHQAVCVDVVELGLQDTPWGQKEKIDIRWQIEQEHENGRRHLITKRYTASLFESSKLREHLEAWRGRRFTDEELEQFDLETLIGANCQLQIVHSPAADGRVWANVQAIVPLGRGQAKIHGEGYVRVEDRERVRHTSDTDEEVPF